jgi:hypothetical protein
MPSQFKTIDTLPAVNARSEYTKGSEDRSGSVTMLPPNSTRPHNNRAKFPLISHSNEVIG